MKRRKFLKTTFGASALAGAISIQTTAAAETEQKQESYELRIYHIRPETDSGLLDAYLEKALLPGLERLGYGLVGVFAEIEPKEGPAVYVLIPYPSLNAFASTESRLNTAGFN